MANVWKRGKPLIIVSVFLIIATSTLPLYGSVPSDTDKIVQHLEFLGYVVDKNEKRIWAKHNQHINFTIRGYKGGMIWNSVLSGNEYSKKNRLEYLEMINSFNRNATTARIYMDQDGDLIFETWVPGAYEKTSFSRYLEAWNHDTLDQIRKKGEAATRFLQ